MELKINGKTILERLNALNVGDRKQTNLYLSDALYKELRDICGVLSASLVVEELIREFVRTARAKKGMLDQIHVCSDALFKTIDRESDERQLWHMVKNKEISKAKFQELCGRPWNPKENSSKVRKKR